MKSILLTLSLISFNLLAVAQETKSKESNGDVKITTQVNHELRIQEIENEIADTERQIKTLSSSITPRIETLERQVTELSERKQ